MLYSQTRPSSQKEEPGLCKPRASFPSHILSLLYIIWRLILYFFYCFLAILSVLLLTQIANDQRREAEFPPLHPRACVRVSPKSRNVCRLTDSSDFKSLSSLPCVFTCSKCSINSHLFYSGFQLFKTRTQLPDLHAGWKKGTPLLGRPSPARLHGWASGAWARIQSPSWVPCAVSSCTT